MRKIATPISIVPLGMSLKAFLAALLAAAVIMTGIPVMQGSGVAYADDFTGDLACVRMLDSDTVWACGVGIVRSENGGPWEDMAPDYSTVTFWDLALLSDSHVIAVSGSGGAIETLDGGITWTAIAGITTPLYGIDYTDGLAYLVGSGGTVYSYDGTTCNLMPQSLTTNDLAGVCALGSEIWAVGGYYMVEGTILHSSDGGANWEPQTSGVNTALMEVDFTDADHGCAVGFDNTIVYTSDGGANWTQAANTSLDPASSVMWVTALEGEVFYAVASTGMNGDSWIMRSTDGGANWTLVEEITGEWLFSLDVLRNEDNPDTVDIWAVGLAAATHHFTDTLPLPPVPFTGDLACVREAGLRYRLGLRGRHRQVRKRRSLGGHGPRLFNSHLLGPGAPQ